MNRIATIAIVLIFLSALTARATQIDQAMPNRSSPPPAGADAAPPITTDDQQTLLILAQDRTGFEANINLEPLRLAAIQHQDQLKILDSWARQSLEVITHHRSVNGQDPLITAFDMAFRPEAWHGKNILFVQAVPIRQQLALLADDDLEKKRLLHQGTISPAFFERESVQHLLNNIAQDVRLSQSVQKINLAYDIFTRLGETLTIAPPPPLLHGQPWHHPLELRANIAELRSKLPADIKPVEGYTEQQAAPIVMATERLAYGWRENNVALANQGIRDLAVLLPAINPTEYPPISKRQTELFYNHTYNGTIVGVFLYFLAMSLFLVAAVGGVKKAWIPGITLFTVAVFIHAAYMGLRWWLAGRIPIQNQFESVMGSALWGCLIGLGIEWWKRNGLFGAATAFMGFLAMTACFVVPFVIGQNIGEQIGTVAGVLADYWLYIHVNIVISSYALITASFALGAIYLVAKYFVRPQALVAQLQLAGGAAIATAGNPGTEPTRRHRQFLELLDAANVVVLQLAFLLLGTGIICGAIWADHSWGRPWGWDPKETFALVTWIVYLIIIHVRLAAPRNKATWTAWLSVAGFAVMLFNWIGVNFFLVGLHSYA